MLWTLRHRHYRHHPRSSTWVASAVYGANDGLASVFGLVAGVAGATKGSSFVVIAGLAAAIANALSMGAGAYLAERTKETPESPGQNGIAAGISTAVGSVIPVVPFLFVTGLTAIGVAALVSLFAAFCVGATTAFVAHRIWWKAGLEMVAIGATVGWITFAIGLLFPSA